MNLAGNLIFFGSVILIIDVLLFSGLFPSQSLNDPTYPKPWILLPIIGTLSFIGLLTLFLSILCSLILLSGIFKIKKNK